jgi:hypothetical protein
MDQSEGPAKNAARFRKAAGGIALNLQQKPQGSVIQRTNTERFRQTTAEIPSRSNLS